MKQQKNYPTCWLTTQTCWLTTQTTNNLAKQCIVDSHEATLADGSVGLPIQVELWVLQISETAVDELSVHEPLPPDADGAGGDQNHLIPLEIKLTCSQRAPWPVDHSTR